MDQIFILVFLSTFLTISMQQTKNKFILGV